ncbi:MAG: hypothetical protein MUF33_14580 [Candidatus Nanopelagicales bacterium]|nr:hypothetical protein [Candidatus Nanopelagicales bacterium]MCU0299722.1 hypothetical protein [Candidatus Nanopelagicales bacterium]
MQLNSGFHRSLFSAATVALILVAGSPQAQASDADNSIPASRSVPAAEQRRVAGLDHQAIARIARPLQMPTAKRPAGIHPARGADGPAQRVTGVAPSFDGSTASSSATTSSAATTSATTTSTAVTGILWPGSSTTNPNRQIGKLYFDIDPSPSRTVWKHCTGTAINSENKSLVLTAGHCVYDITNRRWHTQLWFYPGYENGARLGAWPVRLMSTTANYFAAGSYADDMAVVLVNKDSAGVPLVNRVGGHGIAFNQPINLVRTSFGYPVTDSRWPGFTATGEDLYYCQGQDTYYASGPFAGQMLLSCRMTGGASGGPWLSSVASTWLGTSVSVNSNKGGIGTAWANSMFGPYMGSQEAAVFNTYRAA